MDNLTQFQKREKMGLAATKFAQVVGSWKFIKAQSIFMFAYIVWNTHGPESLRFDPPPFQQLNLLLSFQAAYTGPVILMANNVQEEKDREIVYKDFELSVSTEKELRKILEKAEQTEVDIDEILRKLNKGE